MSEQPQTELVPHRGGKLAAAPRAFSLMPSSLGEAMEIAKLIADSDFAPKDYKGKPGNVMIAIQMGADVGLKPMQALQNIAVINGRPSIWGDAAIALVQGAGVLERFHETIEGEGDKRAATCTIKRKGWPDEIVRTFSVADAKKANLWTKQGPWTTYPDRMLQMRARGFALRDGASDCLMGLILAEEAMDYPDAIDAQVTKVEDAGPVADPLAWVPEGMRDNVEKAFTALSMSVAQRLAKLNEFKGKPELTDEQRATALLEWCRDEYAKRKTGQPRAASDNKKKPAEPKAAEKPAEPAQPVAPPVTEGEVVSEKDIPWGNQGHAKDPQPEQKGKPQGEWF